MVHYYCTIFCSKNEILWSGKDLGDALMCVITHEFQNHAIHLVQTVKCLGNLTCDIRLVPAQFTCTRFINGSSSIPGKDDETSDDLPVNRFLASSVKKHILPNANSLGTLQ